MSTIADDCNQQSCHIFQIADAWFIISEYVTYLELAAISHVNKEAHALMNQSAIWEQQCRRYLDLNLPAANNQKNSNDQVPADDNNRFKAHFKSLIELYGHDCILYYQRVMHCWHELTEWSKQHLPKLLSTFNEPANTAELRKLQQTVCSASMLQRRRFQHFTPYFILLGQCANGQNRELARMGLYGYYTFYNKCSSGHLLSIHDASRYSRQVIEVYGGGNESTTETLRNLWLFCAGIPTQDQLITIPCLTLMARDNGKICKITQDSLVIHPAHGNPVSFIDHLECYVLQHLVRNNYRVRRQFGILRFPISDVAVSECVTKGVLCRGSPLFVPEISNVRHQNYIFPYHIEMECPTSYYDAQTEHGRKMKQRCKECPDEAAPYQLTERKWFIEDDGELERVQGPGVIGLYPKVFVNQKLFQYESCSQQKVPNNGKMYGFFVFQRESDTFELEIKPYKLDW
eukprot:CAMPEP_0197025138 /NCGR_PEP_ID=MMETSP1384-20130603/5557_1 /TAXON_ID=29189 /ORGANISM="Ammonia sp." /LENGTH=458 /DNA_ID=CAMNT_0042453631 /DNA_START=21 /DNA_END=1394 /DNA_ORIENTATION=+